MIKTDFTPRFRPEQDFPDKSPFQKAIPFYLYIHGFCLTASPAPCINRKIAYVEGIRPAWGGSGTSIFLPGIIHLQKTNFRRLRQGVAFRELCGSFI